VAGPGITEINAGGSASLDFIVSNLGTGADSYVLTATGDQPWVDLSGVPHTLSLAAGQTQKITL
jgi:CTP:molybdopterin cytidylyltransferase MocA